MDKMSLSDITLALGVSELSKKYTSVIEIGKLLEDLGSDSFTEAGFWIWDLVTDDFFYSHKFIKTLGYDINDFPYIAETFKELMTEESLTKARENTKDLLNKRVTGSIINNVKYIKKDKSEICFKCSVTLIVKEQKATMLFGTHSF